MQTSRRTSTILLILAAVAVGAVVTWLWYQARHSPDASTVVKDEARGPSSDQTANGDGGLEMDSDKSMAGVAVRVGDETVTVAEVDKQLSRARRSAWQRGKAVDWEWLEARRSEIVERRIKQVALLQLAESRGVEIEPSTLEVAIEAEIQERFGDAVTYQKWLSRHDLSQDDFHQQVEEALIRKALLAEAGVPELDEARLQELYHARRAILHAPARARVDLVTVLARPHGHGGHRRAELARASQLAREMGNGKWPEESPELRIHRDEWLMVPTLPVELQEALVAAGTQQIRGPIQSSAGLHVFRVHEYRPPGLMPFEEAREALREKAREDARQATLESLIGESLSSLQIQRLDQHWYRRALRKARYKRTANSE